jgi:D-alanine--poly(phosphoribitol) ligase subunit 2
MRPAPLGEALMIDLTKSLDLIIANVQELLVESDEQFNGAPGDLNEATRLIGQQGVLTSLELVTLLFNVEQTISDELNTAITLADERAMSQEKSPFRTIGSLAQYVNTLLTEASNHG